VSDCLGKWISAYVDGEIDGRRRDRLVAHLVECDSCRESVAAERGAKLRLAQMSLPAPAPDFRDRLLAAEFSTAEPVGQVPNNHRRRTLLLAGLATATAAAVPAVAVNAPRDGVSGPVVTPPLTQFTQVHFGSTIALPVGGPGLGVQPAAYRLAIP
jgi:anti-sigma factor RsiW